MQRHRQDDGAPSAPVRETKLPDGRDEEVGQGPSGALPPTVLQPVYRPAEGAVEQRGAAHAGQGQGRPPAGRAGDRPREGQGLAAATTPRGEHRAQGGPAPVTEMMATPATPQALGDEQGIQPGGQGVGRPVGKPARPNGFTPHPAGSPSLAKRFDSLHPGAPPSPAVPMPHRPCRSLSLPGGAAGRAEGRQPCQTSSERARRQREMPLPTTSRTIPTAMTPPAPSTTVRV